VLANLPKPESVFKEKMKERILSGKPVPKSEEGRTIETRKVLILTERSIIKK
jgi:hypothetical protein